MDINDATFTSSMRLTGGIDEYSVDGNRFESDIPPYGRKVRFLNDNGYDSDLEDARKYFKENQILTIEEIYVGRSSSSVKFEGYEELFNTVMFEDVEETEWKH